MLTRRKRRSIIWKLPEPEFIKLINNSTTAKEALEYFGFKNKGNNYKTLKSRISELNLDISHFKSRTQASADTRALTKEVFIRDWLVENSNKNNRSSIKKYIQKFKLMDYKCENCKNVGMWDNKPITLQLEHINGISNDNRLENLSFLCPNCHSQTASYAGRNIKTEEYVKNPTCKCGKEISPYSMRCGPCNGVHNRKANYPPYEILQKLILEKSVSAIARDLGVSYNAVKKHIKNIGLV